MAVLDTLFDNLRFGAHLEKFDGTLVRRGTPVEKHWLRYYSGFHGFRSRYQDDYFCVNCDHF